MINQVSVCINALTESAASLHAAAKFAQRHQAKLTGIYIKLDTVEIVRWAGTSPIELTDQLLVDQDKREQNTRKLFDELMSDYQCETQWETILQSQKPVNKMLCTDLIFVEQTSSQDFFYPNDNSFINQLLLHSKRPVIVVPKEWDQSVGKNVLLGWNDSPEAMRATADAVPILGLSEKVLVLEILKSKASNDDQDQAPAIQTYLSSKGIINDAITEHAPGYHDEQAMLLEYAEEHDIDLIVIGCYGHSRLREIVLGGMTEYMLKHSGIPVLYSH